MFPIPWSQRWPHRRSQHLLTIMRQIFDVIAEKGELWLAKNQDDPKEQVGWIWSKHFAKLADS
jgi:hypothetical protein